MSERNSRYNSRPSYTNSGISTGSSINQSPASHRSTANAGYSSIEDEGVDRLKQKVGLLRQISIDMGEEIVEGNRELGSMNTELESFGAQLQDTVKRFVHMAQVQARGGGIYVWLMIFVLAVIMLLIILR